MQPPYGQYPPPQGPPPAYPYPPQQYGAPSAPGVHWVVWLLLAGGLLTAFAIGGLVIAWQVMTPKHSSYAYSGSGSSGYGSGGSGYGSGSSGYGSGSGSGYGSGGSGYGSGGSGYGSGGSGYGSGYDSYGSGSGYGSGGSGGSGYGSGSGGLYGGGAPKPYLPPVKRNIPVFAVRTLDGCSKTDLNSIQDKINDAIDIGAPLYNDGNFAACYSTYESTAQTLERTLPASCKGPTDALKAGRDKASKLTSSSAQAWAMRDTFDGLLNAIDRKGPDL